MVVRVVGRGRAALRVQGGVGRPYTRGIRHSTVPWMGLDKRDLCMLAFPKYPLSIESNEQGRTLRTSVDLSHTWIHSGIKLVCADRSSNYFHQILTPHRYIMNSGTHPPVSCVTWPQCPPLPRPRLGSRTAPCSAEEEGIITNAVKRFGECSSQITWQLTF